MIERTREAILSSQKIDISVIICYYLFKFYDIKV